MSASTVVAVRKRSCFTPPRFRFLLWVILLLFPLRAVPAADPTMTLLRRESQPISEGKTIIRSQYLYQPPAIAGVARPATTVTKEVVVVGCGVNYDVNRGAGQPVLAPSHAALTPSTVAGVAFQSTASPLQVYLPASADHPLAITRNGRTVTSRFVGASADAAARKTDDRTARYSNVLPDTDLVWQVGNGYLKESLILHSRKAPTEFSFLLESADFTFLAPDASQKTFSLREVTAAARAMKVAGPVMLAPLTAKDQPQILVPASFVVDARGKRSCLDCYISRTPTGALLYTMRIPAGFLGSRILAYPLTVDPGVFSVPLNGMPMEYLSGVTYFIMGPISYGYNCNVRIEANAVLKFDPGDGALGILGNSTIRVEGTPYNYAYFTSAYDDSVGADTDGIGGTYVPPERYPNPADYPAAIVIQNMEGGIIQYAKFAYASTAVVIDDNGTAGFGPAVTIEHSIFRNNGDDVSINSMDNQPFCQIRNCLFLGGTAIRAVSNPDYMGYIGLSVNNCTFAGVGTAVDVTGDVDESSYEIKYNVIAGSDYGINYYQQGQDQMPGFTIDRNGLYNVSSFISSNANIDPGNYVVDDPQPPYTSPFASNANGSYYLRDGSPFRNYGDCPAGGLSAKTTTAATGSRIKTADITQSETWSRFDGAFDTGLLDLGYHYDPVDYIIEPSGSAILSVVNSQTSLTINPGVVVAFSPDTTVNGTNVSTGSAILVTSGACIDAQGTGQQPIRFTSAAASGDRIGHPANRGTFNWYGSAIVLYPSGSGVHEPDSCIRHCNISWAATGLSVWSWPYASAPLQVNSSRFSYDTCGVLAYATAPSKAIALRNNLFHHIDADAVATGAANSSYGVLVENCTFDNIGYGVHAQTSTTIQNCLFTINRYEAITTTTACVRQYNYGDDAGEGYPHFDAGNPLVADLDDRYYLDQTLSPCVDKGNPDDKPFMSTARDGWIDIGTVDMGYHYPEDSAYSRDISWSGESYSIIEGTAFGRPWQLRDGSVLCVYPSWAWHPDADNPTTVGYVQYRIGLRRSLDYGRTWGEASSVTQVALLADWDQWTSVPAGTEWLNVSDRTVIVSDPYLLEVSNGDLLCSFREHIYDLVNGNWEWTDFKIRIRRHPAGSTDWSEWQEWCTVQHDQPTTWSGAKWSWTVWDSTLLELPPDPASPNDIRVICFFSRHGAKVSYLQESGQGWPAYPDDYVLFYPDGPRLPYGAARIVTMNKQTGTRTDVWPTTNTPPIIVSCWPDPVDPHGDGSETWVEGWPGPNVTYYDPFPETQTGMCNAVALYGRVVVVFEDGSDQSGRLHVSSVTSVDTAGRVWNRPDPYSNLYAEVHDPALTTATAGGPNLARLTDGRLVCVFMTDEDSTETPGEWPAYEYSIHADVKAVVSDDWGASWTSSSIMVISQRPQRFASWSGLCRLRDDGLLCVFTDGPFGNAAESIKCTRATLVDSLPFEDHVDHLNLDGTPFMWGLLRDWQMATTASYGTVLKGTRGAFGDATAFRGENSWSNYFAQADVKMESTTATAGLCVRVNPRWPGSDFGLYQCYLDRANGKFGFRVLYYYGGWTWITLHEENVPSGFNPNLWHPIAVRVAGSQFDCYLDGLYKFTVNDTLYPNGTIGLRVSGGSALFDNVKALAVP